MTPQPLRRLGPRTRDHSRQLQRGFACARTVGERARGATRGTCRRCGSHHLPVRWGAYAVRRETWKPLPLINATIISDVVKLAAVQRASRPLSPAETRSAISGCHGVARQHRASIMAASGPSGVKFTLLPSDDDGGGFQAAAGPADGEFRTGGIDDDSGAYARGEEAETNPGPCRGRWKLWLFLTLGVVLLGAVVMGVALSGSKCVHNPAACRRFQRCCARGTRPTTFAHTAHRRA